MTKILKIDSVDASTDMKWSKTNLENFDYLQIMGFENAFYITIDFTSDAQMYGFVLFESQKGTAIIRLNGYDGISTSLDSGIEFYKHKYSETHLDIQVLVTSKYAHGFVIVGGSASKGEIIIHK